MLSAVVTAALLATLTLVQNSEARPTPPTARYAFYGSIAEECSFTVEDRIFDLCPLFRDVKGGREGHRESELVTDMPRYDELLVRTITRTPTSTNIHRGTSASAHSQPYATGEIHDLSTLTIRFPETPDRPRVQIDFICDLAVDTHNRSPGSSFVREAYGTHYYIWTTAHACSKSSAMVVTPNSTEVASAIEGSILTDFEEGKKGDLESNDSEKDDLLDPLPMSDRRHRSIAVILLLTGAVLMAISYLIYSPPASFQLFISNYITTRRLRVTLGRVGELKLIRWAAEDMGVLEADEEDQMVNAYGADGEGDYYDALDEEIPLKPTHRRGHFVAQYGST